MEPLSIIAGGGVLVVGWIVGRISRTPKPPKPREPNLICGCDHELAMHDPETNKCHDMNSESHYDRATGRHEYKRVPCNCRQYTGDKPIDTFFSQRLA